MAHPSIPRPLIWSRRVYGALLRAYPPAFRRAHGAAMTQLFRDCCRDAYHERGTAGLLAVWRHTLGDLCRSALHERRAALTAALKRPQHGGTPWAMPAPALGALRQVIPACQTRHSAPWSLTFVSVEHWDGACIANFTVRWRAAADGEILRTLHPGLVLRATDDRGGRYQARQCGGSGGGGPDGGHMNLAYTLTPPLDPAARTLRFEARLQLLTQGSFPPRLVLLRTEPGRWSFAVAVPATESAAH